MGNRHKTRRRKEKSWRHWQKIAAREDAREDRIEKKSQKKTISDEGETKIKNEEKMMPAFTDKNQLIAIKRDLFFSLFWAGVAILIELVLYWKWY